MWSEDSHPQSEPSQPPRVYERVTEPAVPGVCPSCSATMIDRKCKRLCLRCGYFESCADLI